MVMLAGGRIACDDDGGGVPSLWPSTRNLVGKFCYDCVLLGSSIFN